MPNTNDDKLYRLTSFRTQASDTQPGCRTVQLHPHHRQDIYQTRSTTSLGHRQSRGRYVISSRPQDGRLYILSRQRTTLTSAQINVSPHDIVNVQFTSGSTGIPKAAALSHYNIMNCGRYISKQISVTDTNRVCLPVPLFHSFGLIIGICTTVEPGYKE